MNNLEILKNELIAQKQAIEEVGGVVTVANTNPSPAEITAGIKTINGTNVSDATATEYDVLKGKTFYAVDKTIRTGTYPYDVETLNYVLFSDYEAEGLTDRISFYFPDGVKVCRTHLFRECPHAMDIYFSEDLEEIADYTFYECKNFNFPNLLENTTIKKIRSFGFYGCANIQEYLANMPDQIEEILLRSHVNTIKEGYTLKLPANIKNLDVYTFANLSTRVQAKELILPENMTGTLAANVFNLVGFDCDLVTPPGITSIGITFNYRGNFKNITLGENIASIGDRAFGGLASDAASSYILETVTFESETPPTCGKTIFAPQHKTNNFKIYVPDNSLEAYKATTNLTEYASYMHPMSEKA